MSHDVDEGEVPQWAEVVPLQPPTASTAGDPTVSRVAAKRLFNHHRVTTNAWTSSTERQAKAMAEDLQAARVELAELQRKLHSAIVITEALLRRNGVPIVFERASLGELTGDIRFDVTPERITIRLPNEDGT